AAGAADHDLLLLDRDLHRAVAGPVLGVHGIVLHGGVQPQAVSLLAVIEGPLQDGGAGLAPAAASTSPAAPRLGASILSVALVIVLPVALSGLLVLALSGLLVLVLGGLL